MRKIFVSHPFTGNEKINRADAASIVSDLQQMHPDMQFFNPLEIFRTMEGLCDEHVILAACMNLIRNCDAVLQCDGWEKSAGCRAALLQLSTRYRALIVMIYQMKNEQQKTAPKGVYNKLCK